MTAPAGQQTGGGLTPAQLAQLAVLVRANAAVRRQLIDAATTAAVAVLKSFSGWWSDAAVDAMIPRILRVTQAAQRQAARAADAYVARVGTVMTGRPVRPIGAVDVTTLRMGFTPQLARILANGQVVPARLVLGDTQSGAGEHINTRLPTLAEQAALVDPQAVQVPLDPAVPYRRVAEQYRVDVAEQIIDEVKARQRAIVRVSVAAQTDVTLAVREQVRRGYQAIRANGYRRVLHPEDTASGPCGLCVVAADRIYSTGDLMPLHRRCACETLPILGDLDPGMTLNLDDLRRIYRAAGGTGGDVVKDGKRHSGALKNLRVAMVQHAETGPELVDDDHVFRGPAEVAKTQTPDASVRLRHQVERLEASLAGLLTRQAAGDDVDRPVDWHNGRIAELRRELARL